MNTSLVLLLVYSAGLVGLGLWIGRRVRGTSDFFVAGRRLGPGLLFATLLAANIGAGSTVGAASLGYRDGLAGWWWVGSAGIGSLLLAVWIGPRHLGRREDLGPPDRRRLPRAALRPRRARRDCGDAVGRHARDSRRAAHRRRARFSRPSSGCPCGRGCIISGVVMTVYFAAGGLLTSAYVNLVQLVVLLAGLLLALPLVMAGVGGWAGLRAASLAVSPEQLDFWHHGASGVVYLAMLGPAFVISPGLLQKIYGARDARTVRIGVGANAAVLLVFAFVPVLLGMIARARHPDLPTIDLALPTLLVKDLPRGGRRARPRGALLGGGQLGRRHPVHALDVAVAGSLPAVPAARRRATPSVLKVARGAAVAGGHARRAAGDRVGRRSSARSASSIRC